MKIRSNGLWTLGAAILVVAASACQPAGNAKPGAKVTTFTASPSCGVREDEIRLAGGKFLLGAKPELDEEGPAREVEVGAFSIDRTEVTNGQFAAFIAATGYITQAERAPDPSFYPGASLDALKPAALVFIGAEQAASGDPSQWWRLVEGANWRQPEGPASNINGREHHPVVEVSYADALAYAQWRGRDLPTEAEWEFAARVDEEAARFEWGDEAPDGAKPRANTWQGPFPVDDAGNDGYKARTAPVGCFPANRFGLHDMTGNVWEWTKDWYSDGRAQGDPLRQHLIKGGSFLCADNYCLRYRPSARQGGPPDTGSSHIGFRTVKR